MRFRNGKGLDFYGGLSQRIDDYFRQNNLQRTGNIYTWLKCMILMAVYFLLYFFILFRHPPPALSFILALLLGLNSALIFFNLVHDASHKVLVRNNVINNLLRHMGDVVGVNTYIWHIRHDIQHHSFTKVLGGDLIVENVPIIRLSPFQNWRPIHRFQSYYAPLLYLLYSLYWIFFLDFKFFGKKHFCNVRVARHPIIEWIKLILFKAFYILYMIVIPVFYLPYSWHSIVVTFVLMHLLVGILISMVSVLGHEVEGVSFPVVGSDQIINNSWSKHELETTADFANSSKVITWFSGGLNNHICHHLFPNICHVHYSKLTPIIRDYCGEYGYAFNEFTLVFSLKAHWRYLKKLSINN